MWVYVTGWWRPQEILHQKIFRLSKCPHFHRTHQKGCIFTGHIKRAAFLQDSSKGLHFYRTLQKVSIYTGHIKRSEFSQDTSKGPNLHRTIQKARIYTGHVKQGRPNDFLIDYGKKRGACLNSNEYRDIARATRINTVFIMKINCWFMRCTKIIIHLEKVKQPL